MWFKKCVHKHLTEERVQEIAESAFKDLEWKLRQYVYSVLDDFGGEVRARALENYKLQLAEQLLEKLHIDFKP